MWEDKGGSGIWTERVNTDTGESSIKTHTSKIVKQWCGDHYFIWKDIGKRLLVCKHCDYETSINIGLQSLDEGKLILKK